MTEPTATFTTEGHTPVLIEDWLPIRELGIESVRERQAASALPPLSFLHIWWARAPLAAANGVTLTALLPVWSDDLVDKVDGLDEALDRVRVNRPDLQANAPGMSNADWYRVWVLWMCGVWGDPVSEMESARHRGVKPQFSWSQAYKNKPSTHDVMVLHNLLHHRWSRLPVTLDPTAGGGSLPYAAIRYGIPAIANDLNPVAFGVLENTVRIPAEYGPDLMDDVRRIGQKLVEQCQARLEPYFPMSDESESVIAYIYANTISCPRTGGPVPLSPNWWLSKGDTPTAIRLHPVRAEDGRPSHIDFEIVAGSLDFDPDIGTVARGTATSPWDGLVIDGDYVKQEAQQGRMWPTLYAIACKKPKTRGAGSRRYFRAPNSRDLEGLSSAKEELARLDEEWARTDVLPDEAIPSGSKTSEPLRYGIDSWRKMFSDRQLLTHGVFVQEWRKLYDEILESGADRRSIDALTVVALMQAKALDYNARSSAWDVTRQKVAHVFGRHDLAFKWTFGEFDAARLLFPWCLAQVGFAYYGKTVYEGLSRHLQPAQDGGLFGQGMELSVPSVAKVLSGSAAHLDDVEASSIELVNIDPPYYDNVQYSELADFFYVWEKRTLGRHYPERFREELTNKDDEAVANVARFADAGKRKKELATFDYQQKMQAIFAECHRVLVDDGVMVVWFTHKRAEAWDTLATAMMEAGFTIEASWPVATQPEVALNHAKKNSAKSTIMLVCRKRRNPDQKEMFFEDIESEVRQAARTAVEKFEQEVGIGGVDLQLATYGPTLSVISRNWPVLSSEPDGTGRSRRLRPEEALDVARQEVARLRMHRLVGKDATFDPATDFWLMCWETFQAREFPYDEARKLALGVGYDVDDATSSGLLKKKAGNVELVSPATRGRALRRTVDDVGRFDRLVDAVHFMLVTYRDDKLAAARTWLSDSGYGDEQRFIDAVQASVNAVPRVRSKKGLTLDEAVLLEDAVVGLFGDEVSLPVEAEEQFEAEQMTLGG